MSAQEKIVLSSIIFFGSNICQIKLGFVQVIAPRENV